MCDILKKNRVKVSFASPEEPIAKVVDDNLKFLFIKDDKKDYTISSVLGDVKPFTIYKFSNPYRLFFLFLKLPQTNADTLMFIGPYMNSKIDNRQLLEIGEKHNVTPSGQNLLKDFYASVPVLVDSDSIFTAIYTFAERIFGGSTSYSIVDATSDFSALTNVVTKSASDNYEEVMVNMKIMEQRYAFEEELMTAVSMGNDHKVAQIMSSLAPNNFDKRISDPLRNMKNYCIVMNTLLRKAAQEGGVHPLYLDDLSSRYAVSIEQTASLIEVEHLMEDMMKSYCRLVRKHSTSNYSSTVQKTIMLIDYDLSSNLTLSSLAEKQNISSGYLATLFKKETGKTITEFVSDRRISFAMRLLSTTKLQIQTVALHCGIMDVQYFSKIFKKKTGKTPKEYRDSLRLQQSYDIL